jgi:UDP-glucose:(heptosyl)LPS alpha-1,3-glucosyltransferase
MKIAFALFTFFPFGGLTKDLVAIAREARQRGHDVRLFTASVRGECPADLEPAIVPVRGMGNHTRNRRFAERLPQALAAFAPDLVVGFNKMPGLDVYYAADSCFADKAQQKGWLQRLSSRYRHHLQYEAAVFARGQRTHALMISAAEMARYRHHYATEEGRLHLLPPGIRRDRIRGADAPQRRRKLRAQCAIADDELLVLMVGSGFRTKGLDRALRAFAALPDAVRARAWFLVVGHDDAGDYRRQAQALGIAARVRFLGGRDDVPDFLLAADVLIHPAYRENTGTVLLEAMVAGLPVLTTDVCGYAHYVTQAQMGIVVASPFEQSALDAGLLALLDSDSATWQQRGATFAQHADIYDMPRHAVTVIETVGREAEARQ